MRSLSARTLLALIVVSSCVLPVSVLLRKLELLDGRGWAPSRALLDDDLAGAASLNDTAPGQTLEEGGDADGNGGTGRQLEAGELDALAAEGGDPDGSDGDEGDKEEDADAEADEYAAVDADGDEQAEAAGQAPPAAAAGGVASSAQQPPQRARYLHLLSTVEGLAGWTVALREVMHLAVQLDRVLVEPCVRNGRIMPCWPGRVGAVPDGRDDPALLAAVEAGEADPLALPRFLDDCRTANASFAAAVMQPARSRTYPLRAYIDLAALAAEFPALRWVPYDEWAAASIEPLPPAGGGGAGADAATAVAGGSSAAGEAVLRRPLQAAPRGRQIAVRARVVCVFEAFPCRPRRQVIGPYRFRKSVNAGQLAAWAGRHVQWQLGRLSRTVWRRERDVFTARWMRGSWEPPATDFARAPLPAFNALHAAAVRAWLRHMGFPTAGGEAAAAAAAQPQRLPPGVRAAARDASAAGGAGAVATTTSDVGVNDDLTAWRWRYAVVQWRSERVPDGRLAMCARRLTDALRGVVSRFPGARGRHRGSDNTTLFDAAAAQAAALRELATSFGVGVSGAGASAGPPRMQQQDGSRGGGGGRRHHRRAHHRGGDESGSDGDGGGGSGPVRGVLVMDVPAHGVPCSLWGDYRSGTSATHAAAVAHLLSRTGLAKYDGAFPLLDAGVLSIRDALLAAHATWHVTCAGRGGDRSPVCRACTWPSRFVAAVSGARRRLGLSPSHGDMFAVDAGDLRPRLPQR